MQPIRIMTIVIMINNNQKVSRDLAIIEADQLTFRYILSGATTDLEGNL